MSSYVVNLYAGPGVGKSTMNSFIFANLKKQGFNAEIVTEYAKDIVYSGAKVQLEDQLFVMAKQNQRQWRLKKSGVEFIVSDSPLLLSEQYKRPDYFPEYFSNFLLEVFNSYNNINIYLNRVDRPFQQDGRVHDEAESRKIDIAIKHMLDKYGMKYLEVDAHESEVDRIIEYIMACKQEFESK